MIRFDPNNEKFDLSLVFRKIFNMIFSKPNVENTIGKLLIVNFT